MYDPAYQRLAWDYKNANTGLIQKTLNIKIVFECKC